MVPIAAFLAGALLSLLLPVLLLIALAVWYWMFSAGVPDGADRSEPGAAPGAGNPAPAPANPGPSVPETLPPEHGA